MKLRAICAEVLSSGKPLYTFDSEYNAGLIAMGATDVKDAALAAYRDVERGLVK